MTVAELLVKLRKLVRPKRGRDCRVCGGEGWLPSRPEGDSDCPYCFGTGKE
jgi:DnaJ-class molecular chaperone